jgi:hypothetical protein
MGVARDGGEGRGSKDEDKADGFVSLHDAWSGASDWEVLLNSKKKVSARRKEGRETHPN